MAFRTRANLAVLGVCAGLAASPGTAAVYAVVRSQPDVITVMDPAAVEPVSGGEGLRRAWSVSVQRNLISGGPQQPGYVRTLNEYDCADRKVRWKSFFVYSRFGASVMSKENDQPDWRAAAPGSEDEAGLRLVCDHANRWSAVAATSLSQLVISLMQAWDAEAPSPPSSSAATAPAPRKKARP